MSWIPDFEIGIGNTWIFMVWLMVLPVPSIFIIKEKKLLKKLNTSAPMKFEKILSIISKASLIIGFIYLIFLPLKLNIIWFYIGLFIFFYLS
jgi:hypothetical protein